MDQDTEIKRLSMRCPVCFSREIDVLMIPDGTGRHRCAKCSFSGTEKQVRALYRDIRKKYRWMGKRLTLDAQRAL